MTQSDVIQHVNNLGYSIPVICSVGSRAFGYETPESDWDYVVYSKDIKNFSVENMGSVTYGLFLTLIYPLREKRPIFIGPI